MTLKDTKNKLRLNLVPPETLIAIAEVRAYGCTKYNDEDGFRHRGMVKSTDFIEAAKRHILKYDLGEKTDSESGLPHLNHALASLSLAIDIENYEKTRVGY